MHAHMQYMQSALTNYAASQSRQWLWAVVLQQEVMDDGKHLALNLLAHQNVKVACSNNAAPQVHHECHNLVTILSQCCHNLVILQRVV